MSVSLLIREARSTAGLSQIQLADLAATSQPAISAYENGSQSPTAATLERLVNACGLALTTTTPANEPSLASLVARFVEAGDFDDEAFVLRWSLNQFARNEWDDLTPSQKSAALQIPPPPSGSLRWDAFFVSLADYLAETARIPVPKWVSDADRVVPGDPWYPGRTGDRDRAERRVARDPARWFVSRGIGLEMRALPSGKGKHIVASA
jgi:transcriptional regulator with XRE-family HTH domain